MHTIYYSLVVSICLCARVSEAFVSTVNTSGVRSGSRNALRKYVQSTERCPPGHAQVMGRGRRGKTSSGVCMMMKIKKTKAPILTEEELAEREVSIEQSNRILEEYLEVKRAEREAQRREEEEKRRNKIATRLQAEKDEAEHKKVYIPQRLEEIEREQELLKDRVSAFNDKVKDKKIKQL